MGADICTEHSLLFQRLSALKKLLLLNLIRATCYLSKLIYQQQKKSGASKALKKLLLRNLNPWYLSKLNLCNLNLCNLKSCCCVI